MIQHRLSTWVAGTRQQLSLPLRLALWNGQQIDFSPEPPRVTIGLPTAAAHYLLAPSLSKFEHAGLRHLLEYFTAIHRHGNAAKVMPL